MSHTPHELHEEFPDYASVIACLKSADIHFARLSDKYHMLNRQIHRVETNIEPMDDLAAIGLRKERAQVKDQLFGMIKALHPTS
ncbi:YdcH family protein [Pseudooceanicola sp. C21-150M6]|uniref:YdcH family protein n=1 Tax=Pseudooceanicola sp. C21-150M6 TaxID=3434355 RepID=UPI003D7FB162